MAKINATYGTGYYMDPNTSTAYLEMERQQRQAGRNHKHRRPADSPDSSSGASSSLTGGSKAAAGRLRQTFAIPFDVFCERCTKLVPRGTHCYVNRQKSVVKEGEEGFDPTRSSNSSKQNNNNDNVAFTATSSSDIGRSTPTSSAAARPPQTPQQQQYRQYLGMTLWELSTRCRYCDHTFVFLTDYETPKLTGGYHCHQGCRRVANDFRAANEEHEALRSARQRDKQLEERKEGGDVGALEAWNEKMRLVADQHAVTDQYLAWKQQLERQGTGDIIEGRDKKKAVTLGDEEEDEGNKGKREGTGSDRIMDELSKQLLSMVRSRQQQEHHQQGRLESHTPVGNAEERHEGDADEDEGEGEDTDLDEEDFAMFEQLLQRTLGERTGDDASASVPPQIHLTTDAFTDESAEVAGQPVTAPPQPPASAQPDGAAGSASLQNYDTTLSSLTSGSYVLSASKPLFQLRDMDFGATATTTTSELHPSFAGSTFLPHSPARGVGSSSTTSTTGGGASAASLSASSSHPAAPNTTTSSSGKSAYSAGSSGGVASAGSNKLGASASSSSYFYSVTSSDGMAPLPPPPSSSPHGSETPLSFREESGTPQQLLFSSSTVHDHLALPPPEDKGIPAAEGSHHHQQKHRLSQSAVTRLSRMPTAAPFHGTGGQWSRATAELDDTGSNPRTTEDTTTPLSASASAYDTLRLGSTVNLMATHSTLSNTVVAEDATVSPPDVATEELSNMNEWKQQSESTAAAATSVAVTRRSSAATERAEEDEGKRKKRGKLLSKFAS